MRLFGASLAALALALVVIPACTSAPLARLPVCITDPVNNLLHCEDESRAWSRSTGYVCAPIDAFEAYINGCRK